MPALVSTHESRLATFDSQFDQLWAIAYRVAYRVLGSREDAEDVAQDALVKVGLRWKTVAGYAPPYTARVAGQRAIDVWRHREHGRTAPRAPHVGAPATAFEDRDELVTALRRLPTRQREAVLLRYVGDFSEHDTAAALGCSEGSVKTHASRGLAALRSTIRPSGDPV